MRKHIAWYISGMRGAARFREKINALESAEAVKNALMEFAAEAEQQEDARIPPHTACAGTTARE